MLNIFYGRESANKDKFLFDSIEKQLQRNENVILLVPDQFTLQAEQNAFDYLQVDGLMDLEIFSISRLGFRILSETGGGKRAHINKYGRHMLLTKILVEEENNLKTFGGMCRIHSFVDMLNNFISEMKQYGTANDALSSVLKTVDEASLLYGKLKDLELVYGRYQSQISGKYVDSEDYISLFASQIRGSKLVKNATVWVTGFDCFAPKNLEVLEQILVNAKETNFIMTKGEFGQRDSAVFQITEDMVEKISSCAYNVGVDKVSLRSLSESSVKKSSALSHLEKELYAYPHKVFEKPTKDITFCQCANLYAEAESAAKFIVDLVQLQGYAYKDIMVILNDMETRASILKRVFSEYDIPFFLDKKRDVSHNPVMNFIDGILDFLNYGWNYQNIFRLYKTELFPIDFNGIQDFENYVIKYKIVGGKWKKPFTYGVMDVGEDVLAAFNEIRVKTVSFLDEFEKTFNGLKNVRGKTEALYDFLNEKIELPVKIAQLMEFLQKKGEKESVLETAQIWNLIVEMLNQTIVLLDEERIDTKGYTDLLRAGFSEIELGILPPTIDEVLVGTMQRTRGGGIKALVVIGANDGLLPNSISSEGLFSEDEKIKILKGGKEICKLDDLRMKEESLAIYKTFSKPTDCLWISYSVTDLDGRESKPSLIFEKIREIFPNVEQTKDILNRGNIMDLICTPKSTLKHLSQALLRVTDSFELDESWLIAKDWYFSNEENKKILAPLLSGILFTNGKKKIEEELANMLYNKSSFSPSQLERFSKCPFSYFINFGLRPDENRVFEVTGREMGDLYHETIKEFFEKGENVIRDYSEDECKMEVAVILEKQAELYKEGLLHQGPMENYRLKRMKSVCAQAVWALLEQYRQGKIEKMFFESKFGRNSDSIFPAITIESGENTYLIEGKIDRVDVLEENYIKIIDYKSGKEKFSLNEVRAGLKLQLMLYLEATLKYSSVDKAKPAGVFYFEIAEKMLDVSEIKTEGLQTKLESEIQKSYRLDGIVLDNYKIIEGITGEFEGYSSVLPIRKNKDGLYVGTSLGKVLSFEEFQELQGIVRVKAKEVLKDLNNGRIDVLPKKTKTGSACTFCQYKSICNFDLVFDGCRYDVIK